MKISYYKELDGVRAIAALMVVFFHFAQGLAGNSSSIIFIHKYFKIGQTGVSLFFVLSGFLITRILLEAKKEENYFYNFYIRRSLRIFPLYYLFLILYYFIFPLYFNQSISTFKQQFYYWSYLQDFASTFNWNAAGPFHFWSLAIEEHFYLFWPWIVYFFNIRKITALIFLIVLSAFVIRVMMAYKNYEVFYFTFTRFDEIALGALLAIFEAKKALNNKNSKRFFQLFVTTLVPTALLWIAFTNSGNFFLQTTKFILISVVYFSFVALVITCKENSFLKKCLRMKFFAYTGKISYGIYVYHPICFYISLRFFLFNNIACNFLSGLAFTYIVATASYFLFEIQFLKLKKFFEGGNRQNLDSALALTVNKSLK